MRRPRGSGDEGLGHYFTIRSLGGYRLDWQAMAPFAKSAGGGRACGVTISVTDAAGNAADIVGGVSTTLAKPSTGSAEYPWLDAGDYTVDIYVGCPWSVTIKPAE